MSESTMFAQDPGPPRFRILGLEPLLLKRIVGLGWPVIVGMLTQSAINTIDLLFVGRLPDEIAVPGSAAMLVSIVLLWAFGGFLSAVSVGTQAIAARRYSEGRLDLTGAVLSNSILVATTSSIALTAVAFLAVDFLVPLLTPSPAVQKIAISYSKIRFLGLLGMALMASYKSFYDGMGRVKIHMGIAIVMNICNAITSYLLIFGFSIGSYQVAPMNVDGAALGALLSSYVGLIIMIIWSLRRKDRATFRVYHWGNLDLRVAGAIAKLSVWSGLATVVLMGGVGLFNHIVGLIDQAQGMSDVNGSAASIIIHVMMLVFMTALAFGTSTATLVSQSVGAKQYGLAGRYAFQSVLLGIYAMSIFGAFAVLFPEPILHLFLPSDLNAHSLKDAVVQTAIPSFRLAAGLLSPISAAGLVMTQALYGAGETRYVMIVEFFLHFGCLVPLAYLFSIYLDMGLIGCWYAGIIYASALLLATAFKFWRGDWKYKVI